MAFSEDADIDPADATIITVITLGDQQWEVSGLPGPGSVYLAAAGPGGPATVEVADDGRVQGLNLLARERMDPVEAYYQGEFTTKTFTITGEVHYLSLSGQYFGDLEYDDEITVARSAYDSERGWLVEPDQALITVELEYLLRGPGFEFRPDPDGTLVRTTRAG